jgi:alkylhydroperoxidase/carboxymuconolactone decarboxylase family protein YurZ
MNQRDSDRSPLDKLREWDSDWAERCRTMGTNVWSNGILPVKEIELICIGLNAACTNLSVPGTRRHIRAALAVGATREEILEVLKTTWGLAVHSLSLGAPILLEEAKAAGVKPVGRGKDEPTPSCDKMRAIGQWNTAWDPFFELDPAFTDQLFAVVGPLYQSGVLTPKLLELLSVALDAWCTHMYAPGTRRHIKAALKAGATMEEIMEVLKLCVAMGVEVCGQGVTILAEELERSQNKK